MRTTITVVRDTSFGRLDNAPRRTRCTLGNRSSAHSARWKGQDADGEAFRTAARTSARSHSALVPPRRKREKIPQKRGKPRKRTSCPAMASWWRAVRAERARTRATVRDGTRRSCDRGPWPRARRWPEFAAVLPGDLAGDLARFFSRSMRRNALGGHLLSAHVTSITELNVLNRVWRWTRKNILSEFLIRFLLLFIQTFEFRTFLILFIENIWERLNLC